MAWHISLSHRILRERWEDYWHAATGIRLDFLSNHCNMQLYKEGSHRFGLVLTQSLSAWKQRGGFTRDWGLGHVRKPSLCTMSCWFLEGDSLCQGLRDGAGEESCASLLALEQEWHQRSSTACPCRPVVGNGTGSVASPASPHVAPHAPIAVISSFASWFPPCWSSCFWVWGSIKHWAAGFHRWLILLHSLLPLWNYRTLKGVKHSHRLC